MDARGERRQARLAVTPGNGWIARRGTALLFVPDAANSSSRNAASTLAAEFLADGPTPAVRTTDVERCIVEWSDDDATLHIDSTFEVIEERSLGDTPTSAWSRIAPGRSTAMRHSELPVAFASDIDVGGLDSRGDFRDGDAPAGGFVLVLAPTEVAAAEEAPAPPADVTVAPAAVTAEPIDVTAEPEQFVDLTDLDVTLAPAGPVTYPDDDTDRTIRRPGDIRCPRGHANANTNITCRVCGESLDSTAGRPGPRASTAVAGLRLPDGSIIPINRLIAIGRAPSAAGAGLDVTPRLVTIDAPSTVSRTHVLLRLEHGTITATDCGARGRTAVLPVGHETPIALEPWEPRPVSIGDTIQLGGPTTLTITDPDELRIPPAFEPTARPPERNDTT